MRPWAEALLDQSAPLDGLIDLVPVRAAWKRHLAGADQAYRLWTVLSLLAWEQHWRSGASGSVTPNARLPAI